MPKVLIVDDDRTTVKLLQTLLELDGFEVSSALKGADVLITVEQSRPDIMLIDYHLSDMDGVEVIRQLRKHDGYASMPIVMASGLDVQEEAIGAGASLFLVKPFEPGELPRLFNKLLNG
ncbi:MAG: response regulator receiver protein [Chloroflexi bacterium OLB15]|nr:MAG: response regulator receiver protein [Chloroflexi bacterium OLB15]